MSNSVYACYRKISPNRTVGRSHKIDTITIHCMAGDLSIEECGDLFAKSSTGASSNYGIGSDGRVAVYVDEKERSWCSSNRDNDMRAVTIEVANIKNKDGKYAPDYLVSAKAYASLIDLLVDICKRNKIDSLKWKADPSLIGNVSEQNMTVHRWFKNKECPGKYLYDHMGDIADAVNSRLCNVKYRVQVGSFKRRVGAVARVSELVNLKYDAFIREENGKFTVQAGVFSDRKHASELAGELKQWGFPAKIVKVEV